MDAYLAILLLTLPSVDYLRIDPVLLIETDFFGRVLKSTLCDKPPSLVPPAGHPASLQVLRELSLYRRDYSPNPNTLNILPVFYLPSLRKMSIYIDDPAGEFRWPTGASSPPQAVGLESLEVEGLHEAQLGNLLSATPSLSSLTWIREFWVESADYPGPLALGPIISLHSLGTYLGVVKDTLAGLGIRANDLSVGDRLRPDPGDEMSNTVVRFEGPLRSLCLAEFKRLKVLEVPSVFIMGFPAVASSSSSVLLGDNLPPTIEELKISTEASWSFWNEDFDSSCEFPYVQGILTWLADVERHTPSIRKFSYVDYSASYYQTKDQEHLAAKNKMRELAVRAGIEYTHNWRDWLGNLI